MVSEASSHRLAMSHRFSPLAACCIALALGSCVAASPTAVVDTGVVADATERDVGSTDAIDDVSELDTPGDADAETDAGADAAIDAEPDLAEDIANDVAIDTVADSSLDTVDAGEPRADLDDLLAQLRANPESAARALSTEYGWPIRVAGGRLVVQLEPLLPLVAGHHDEWAGTEMTVETGFSWVVVPLSGGHAYKFTDGADQWQADPLSRAYGVDENGPISYVEPTIAHSERWLDVTDGVLPARTLRIWMPEELATHVLYAHDGQNLFYDGGIFGSWSLEASAPPGLMVVGIDNAGADRIYEYTHVSDFRGDTQGGGGALYAAFVQEHVRPLIHTAYTEPPVVGTLGSSLGGLISLYIAHAYPGEYDMAISLSGTVGWGKIGADNNTLLDLYGAAGLRSTRLYIDSGGGVDGGAGACMDSDDDGINDDNESNADNFCENRQLADALAASGYVWEESLWHWHELDAEHNEAAWAARVARPMKLFVAAE
jgi:hypothetical protein